jgi:hypothetical protein
MKKIGSVSSIFGELPEENQRIQIIGAIRSRSAIMTNCASFTGFFFYENHRYIPEPRQSPSGQARVRSEKFIDLKIEFRAHISYLNEFRDIAPKGDKDPNVPLLLSAENFFRYANKIGAEILLYAVTLQKKIFDNFCAKTFEAGVGGKDECANTSSLAIFIVERQLGILNEFQGINTVPGTEENAFASLQLSSGSHLKGSVASGKATFDFLKDLGTWKMIGADPAPSGSDFLDALEMG